MIGVYHIDGIDAKIVARNYYDGTVHVSWENGTEFGIAEKVRAEGNTLAFTLPSPLSAEVELEISGQGYSGTVNGSPVSGNIAPITDEDDRIGKSVMKKKALILYATITKNTERIARAFAESFEYYGWEAELFRITNKTESMPST